MRANPKDPTPKNFGKVHPGVTPGEITLISKQKVNLAHLHLDLSRVEIGTLAHSLSNICRFTGHVRAFYSVAEHSVLVSRIVPPQHALAGLVHDLHEALVTDVASPVKPLISVDHAAFAQELVEQGFIRPADRAQVTQVLLDRIPGYREIERRAWLAVAHLTGVSADLPEEVLKADLVMLATERLALQPFDDETWECLKGVEPVRDPALQPRCLPPVKAYDLFMRRWDELGGAIRLRSAN